MNLLKQFLLIIFSVFLLNACRDADTFLSEPSAKLTLRSDTVFFDTVFTTYRPGIPMSVNKQFTVVNPYKQTLKTSVRITNPNSFFSINVDGEKGPEISNLEILPGDSVFVFVEVYVEPNQDPNSMPLLVRDSIEFMTNGNAQYVQLNAYGQNGHYFLRDSLCDKVLDDKEKPYVVQGYLYVPENCVLTIKPGVRMYFAPKAWLYVEGTLIIEGTESEPVIFEGDRLQPSYEEVPGQWGGIWLNYLSKDNRIDYARIKNGTVGIYCDSSSSNGKPTVTIKNTKVRNMLYDGLSGKMSHIVAINSVFDNCGRYSFLGLWGGNYTLYHCNFLTYGYYFARRNPTFVLNNIETDDFGNIIETYEIRVDVQNSIVYGSLEEEVGLGLVQDSVLAFKLDYNLLKTKQKLDQGGLKNILNKSPEFVNYQLYDYHLKATSPAIDKGTNLLGVITDFEGQTRDSKPDIGADELN